MFEARAFSHKVDSDYTAACLQSEGEFIKKKKVKITARQLSLTKVLIWKSERIKQTRMTDLRRLPDALCELMDQAWLCNVLTEND